MAAGLPGYRITETRMKTGTKKNGKTFSGLRKVLHDTFEVGIILKGIDGAFEIAGGLLLYLISPAQINRALLFLLQHELSEDPRDAVANFLIRTAGHLSVKTQLFGSIYLLSHGIVKAGIVISLWKNRLWAYPAAIVFFAAFIVYQLYRYTYSHSLWLIILTVFDIVIVLLTWLEYRRVKAVRQERRHV
jgi:uncharacterized membrane protein